MEHDADLNVGADIRDKIHPDSEPTRNNEFVRVKRSVIDTHL